MSQFSWEFLSCVNPASLRLDPAIAGMMMALREDQAVGTAQHFCCACFTVVGRRKGAKLHVSTALPLMRGQQNDANSGSKLRKRLCDWILQKLTMFTKFTLITAGKSKSLIADPHGGMAEKTDA